MQETKLQPPTQQLTFLGFIIDTVAGKIRASAARARELKEAAHTALATGARLRARLLARVAGQVASLSPAFGNAARIFTRGLHTVLPTRQAEWGRKVEVTAAEAHGVGGGLPRDAHPRLRVLLPRLARSSAPASPQRVALSRTSWCA